MFGSDAIFVNGSDQTHARNSTQRDLPRQQREIVYWAYPAAIAAARRHPPGCRARVPIIHGAFEGRQSTHCCRSRRLSRMAGMGAWAALAVDGTGRPMRVLVAYPPRGKSGSPRARGPRGSTRRGGAKSDIHASGRRRRAPDDLCQAGPGQRLFAEPPPWALEICRDTK